MNSQKSANKFGDFLFLYRGIIPVGLLLVAFSVRFYNARQGATYEAYFDIICLCMAILGLAIRMTVVGHSPKGTSGRNKGRQLADQLNTKGWYSMVRHPLYVANFLVWLSVALLGHSSIFMLIFLILFAIFYRTIITVEEHFLEKKFGPVYLIWKKATPKYFPNPFQYESNQSPFNLKKVIRKEKNGVAAVFLVFFLFQLIDAIGSAQLSDFLITHLFWVIAMIVSGMTYFSIKIITKKTNWLH
ncbi:MAG: isoprenylcysteine carboxylmethyltransferase family protein [Marinoscillum sp.]